MSMIKIRSQKVSKMGSKKGVKNGQKWGISKSVNFRGVKNGQKVEKKKARKIPNFGGVEKCQKID